MLEIDIPGGKKLTILHLVLDVNGTLALDGELLAGVEEAVSALRNAVNITLLTANTFGRGREIAAQLAVDLQILNDGNEREQKAACVRRFGAENVAAIGQGANDELMLKEAALGICVLSAEGTAISAMLSADILAMDGAAALQLLLHPTRIQATLRR